MPDDKQSFLQRAKIAVNKVYLDATNKLVMDRPSYGRDQSEKRTAVEMSRRQGEQEYWDYLKRNSADEFYKQASVNLGQTSGPRPMDALTQGASHLAESREWPEWAQTGVRYAPLVLQAASLFLRGGGAPKLEEPMPAPGMRLNLAPGKAMEIAKVKAPMAAVGPSGPPAGDLGELETGLQASAKRMFPSVEERTAGTQIGDAIAARKYTSRTPGVEMEANYDPETKQGYISAIQRKGAEKGQGAAELKNYENWVSEKGGGKISGAAEEGSQDFWKGQGYQVGSRNKNQGTYFIQKEVPAQGAVQTEGGHGGGGVASVEELNRQREYVNVGRGKTGYQGVQPDPGARGIEPGRAIYSTPKGKAEWRLESGTPAADHQGALDGWAKAMGRTSVKVGSAAVAGALAGAGTASAASPSPEDIDKMVTKHAEANNLDPKLLHEVVRSESSYNPNARSGKGARGLTQLMPATARAMGVDPKDPEQNVSGGAKYLAQLRERFGDLRKTLAAYNWGPTNVAKHGDAWYEHAPQETRNYVDRIMQRYGGAVKTAQVNPSDEGGEWSTTDPQRQ